MPVLSGTALISRQIGDPPNVEAALNRQRIAVDHTRSKSGKRTELAATVMQGLGARQASIDYHLEMTRRCLALPTSQRSLLSDDPLQCEEVVEQPQLGSRIAAKIIHLRNLTAALTPVPATTEVDQYSVFDRFRASVETLWSDRREHGARDRMDSQPHPVQVHVDPSMSCHSLECSSISAPRHRRAGSSRI